MQKDSAEHAQILRKRAVIARTGLSDTTIWRMVRAGQFPRPVQLTNKLIGWKERDIEAWIESR